MTDRSRFGIISLLLSLLIVSACGSSEKEAPPEAPIQGATTVGSSVCLNCHSNTVDPSGTVIGPAWSSSAHTTVANVQCEDCHGPGSLHFGIGPIPFPIPGADQCNECHGFTGFLQTAHFNPNGEPDEFFFQGGTGTDQAENLGQPEVVDGTTTPVTKNQHIEECSRCHNPNLRFEYDSSGNFVPRVIRELGTPRVNCPGCHDAHDITELTPGVIPQRASQLLFPVFRPYIIDPATGAQVTEGTNNSTSFQAVIFQPNGAVKADGSVDYTSVSATVNGNLVNTNELDVERLCAACHTKGLYKYGQTPTHQTDVFTQWTTSAHADRSAPPFAEFSANPPAYISPAGTPYAIGSHRSTWPFDMAISDVATTADTTHNGSYIPAGSTSPANNYVCYKCHNGLTSIAYQENTEGTSEAPVVFGDEPVTCVTCHDPHMNFPPKATNTRVPAVMTVYSSPQISIDGNVFLDNTPVPDGTGNATICVFCHQGRESGLTLFKRKLSPGTTITGPFFNPHYLGTGAMLWEANGYEFGGKLYGVNQPHQQTNCPGCHMATAQDTEVGGHTWKIVSDDDTIVNAATCNAAGCHSGRVPTTNSGGEFDNFRDTVFDPTNDYDGNGVVEGIPVEMAGMENKVIGILLANGIEYDDLTYPYFFQVGLPHTNANAFTAWTPPLYKAAFNLSFVIKGLPSEPDSQIGEPNPSAATHNFRYNLELLYDGYEAVYNSMAAGTVPASIDIAIPNTTDTITVDLLAPSALVRPDGTVPAANYNPQPGGGYDPAQ